ncbi:MAG: hypothetical protein AB8U88_01505 [Rickettsia conorii subsp. raoultii]|uniref:Uncharacterized protein n=1 Tax=Rickettsia conorii subsp. raoultii TaxID=369822 RepID=A0A9N7AZ97_RICCR|nr:hypothetical protein [Rickettsia conorii]AJQ51463.1 hypothetical protein UQ52_00750 [Rickettsia conorii subsp. raoultii]APZ29659.1 hypothetical protein RRIM16_00815 [Rickettsia conorii subsp. raoultii]URW78180.1 hypothetical protein NBT09_02255 [Rickettsia conorii subsp. raoultii]
MIEQDLIKVRIIGGNDSPESSKYLEDIRTTLNGIDNNTNMINIIGLDVCKNIHPNSFELDGYHVGVRALD